MGKIFSELKSFIDSLLFVENPRCPICNRVMFGNGLVCDRCGEKLSPMPVEKCLACKNEDVFNDNALCAKCRARLPYLNSGTSLFIYDEISKLVIYDFKFNSNMDLAKVCGKELWKKLCNENLNMFDVITYVPMSKQKENQRGYNQAEEIARGVAVASDKLVIDMLYLQKEVKDQITLDNIQRAENVRNAFSCSKYDVADCGTILLVDDVMTTGSTLNECAETLLSAGAEKVIFAVIACA